MKKFNIVFLIICISSFSVFANDQARVVRLLNWWDYLAPRTIQKLEQNKYKIDLSVYSSTEIATSRLLSSRDKYDVVIISGMVKEIIQQTGRIEKQVLNEVVSKRNYLSAVIKDKTCVPYFWGASIFAYDAKSIKIAPSSIADLVKLKKQGVSVGLLDDPFEITTRLKLDGQLNCLHLKSGQNNWNDSKCTKDAKLSSEINFSAADFRSDVEAFLKKNNSAVYSWHGAAWLAAKENPNIQLVVPQKHPVIGVDYVCIPKNRAHPKLSKEQLVKFVELLTDPESTHWGVESTQYFSPYKNDLQGLSPAVVKLYQNLMSVMAQSSPFVLTAPEKDEHQLINNWWRGVRYESKK